MADAQKLTDAELTILGLLAESPRHAYDLDAVIEQRGIREWTAVGFSSIYYLLKKLENKSLVCSNTTTNTKRVTYALKPEGFLAAKIAAKKALAELRPEHPAVLVGIANSALLGAQETIDALEDREQQLAERLAAVHTARTEAMGENRNLPDHVHAVFEYSISRLTAEKEWLKRTLIRLEKR